MGMLREQVTVHRGEFGELEASTTRRISELEILLEGERNKVLLKYIVFSVMYVFLMGVELSQMLS